LEPPASTAVHLPQIGGMMAHTASPAIVDPDTNESGKHSRHWDVLGLGPIDMIGAI
jgi:hypothetical protein